MDIENTTYVPTTSTNPKKALIQKSVILLGATIGLFVSVGVTLPKFNVHKDGDFEVGGDLDD